MFTGTAGVFTGTAGVCCAQGEPGDRLAGAGAELRYAERGELRFGAHAGPAARSLAYQGLDDGTVTVPFTDRRPFYLLDLRTGTSRAAHVCGADRYEITHRVLGADLLEERWRVIGPDKDYLAITTLARDGWRSS